MSAPDSDQLDPLVAGQEALGRGDWERAAELLADAALEDSAEAWEAVGWAAWWRSDEAATIAARERAFRLFRAGGDDRGAARAAIWIAADFREYRGEDGIGRGWLERADALLAPLEESAEDGWLRLLQADFALNVDGDLPRVAALAREAVEIGRREGVADIEAVGGSLEGLALVGAGEAGEGMRILEAAGATALTEEMALPISAGWTLCCVLAACDGIGEFGRAEQWCEAIRRFTERWGGRQLAGVCRTSYGRILATRGNWPEAEGELAEAIRDIDSSRPGMAGTGLARLGELRARQGRWDEARDLYERAGPAGFSGLGELALAEGDATAALEIAERCLRRVPDNAVLQRLPALELRARAEIAAGDPGSARESVEAITRIAESIATPYVAGRAAALRAELAATDGDHDDARCAAEDAVDAFAEAAAVHEGALARITLSGSLAALGQDERSGRELAVARETLERLGAAAELGRLEARGGNGELTPRELEILRLVARGMSDAAIAEELVLSPHTVHRHVANVRTKLRLPSRSAAVAHAAREGLI